MNTSTAQSDQSQSLRLGAGDVVADAKTRLRELGKLRFVRYGDVKRQSAQIKLVVHDRLATKAKR